MSFCTKFTQERDKLQNETISRDDMMDVFRIYGVIYEGKYLHSSVVTVTAGVDQNTVEEDYKWGGLHWKGGLYQGKCSSWKISYLSRSDLSRWQYAQDMKLLDFTGRKVDPSLMLGEMKTKKERDPNIKVRESSYGPVE